MGKLRRSSLGLCLLAAASFAASGAEVVYHPTHEAALGAAKENGQLVMIVVIVGPSFANKGAADACKAFVEKTLGHEQVAPVINHKFAPMLLDIQKVNERKQPKPPVLGGVTRFSVPSIFFFDTEGKQVARLENLNDQGFVDGIRKIGETVEAHPPDQPKGPTIDMAGTLKLARAAVEAKDWVAAMATVRAMVDDGTACEELEQAREIANQIEARAQEVYEEAQRLEAEPKLGSAIRRYRQCVRQFHGTEHAAEAAERLKVHRGDPELRARLKKHMARKLLDKAKADVAARRYAAAADSLDTLLTRYAGAPQADEAKALREKLRSDPAIAARMNEDKIRADAERLLRIARSFQLNRMSDKAIEQYQKIIKTYPGTRFAADAERRIQEIKLGGGSR